MHFESRFARRLHNSHEQQQQTRLKSQLVSLKPPNYDVKIVAGKRIVIYRDDDNDNQNSPRHHHQQDNNKTTFADTRADEPDDESTSTEITRLNLQPIQQGNNRLANLHLKPYDFKYVQPKIRESISLPSVNTNFLGLNRGFSETELPESSGPLKQEPDIRLPEVNSKEVMPSSEPDSRDPNPDTPRSASSETDPLNVTYTLTEDGKLFPESLGGLKASGRKPKRSDPPAFDEKTLQTRVQNAMRQVNERVLDKMLIEMRSRDRDRDRVLRPIQMKVIFEKYKIPLTEELEQLQQKFEDKAYRGCTNYEDLVEYLMKAKSKAESSNDPFEPPDTFSNPQIYDQRPQSKPRKQEIQRNESDRDLRNTDSSSPFMDRENAMLIMELEKTIVDSPKFDLQKFQRELEAKDVYGNEQVSKQQIVMAASNANLIISKPTLSMLMQACDPTRRGIYNIRKLVSFLERSQTHILHRQPGHSRSATHSMNQTNMLNSSLRSTKSLPISKSDQNLESVPRWETRQPLQMLPAKPQAGPEEHLQELGRRLFSKQQFIPGYLPLSEVKEVCNEYNRVFRADINKSRVQKAAIRTCDMDTSTDQVNLSLFLKQLQLEMQA